jgi:hypothetical protein
LESEALNRRAAERRRSAEPLRGNGAAERKRSAGPLREEGALYLARAGDEECVQLEPARLGELLHLLKNQRRLIARARVLMPPAHLGKGPIPLLRSRIPVQPVPLFAEKLTERIPCRQADPDPIRPQLFNRRPFQVV